MNVSGLFVYPIKACAGSAQTQARLTPRGLAHDRWMMVVDADGRFLTQRECPTLALVTPTLDGERLTLSAAGLEPIAVTLRHAGERQSVVVWRSTCDAIDQGDVAAEWFSTHLGRAVRLVRAADDFHRTLDATYAPRPGDTTAFADGYPILVISEASLTDLNARLATALPMNRFRPNIVVQGAEPYAEDVWRCFTIGGLRFEGVKTCARCVVTTTDQATAQRGREPLATLAAYRDSARGVLFGQNVIQTPPEGSPTWDWGSVTVGDPVVAIADC